MDRAFALFIYAAAGLVVLSADPSSAAECSAANARIGSYGYVDWSEPNPLYHPLCEGEPTWYHHIRAFRCDGIVGGGCPADEDRVTELTGYDFSCVEHTGVAFNDCPESDEPKEEADAPKTCGVDSEAHQDLKDSDASQQKQALLGDPVDLTRGSLSRTETDLDLGRGLRFTRHYSSELTSPGVNSGVVETSMGARWRHSLQWQLRREQTEADALIVLRPMRTPAVFMSLDGGATWMASQRSNGAISGTPTGTVTYTTPDGTQVEFDASDELVAISPPGEPAITVTSGQPTANDVTYSNGVDSLVVSHHSSGDFDGLVESVSGGGDTVSYDYEVALERPAVLIRHLKRVSLPNHATGTGTITLDYAYATDALQHSALLASVTRNKGKEDQLELGSWEWTTDYDDNQFFKVIWADEPALDQPLTLSYSGTEGDTTVTITDGTNTLATVTNSDYQMVSATGTGGPGYDLGYLDAVVEGERFAVKENPRGFKTAYESYDSQGRPEVVRKGWSDTDDDDEYDVGEPYETLVEYEWHPRLNQPIEISRTSTITDIDGDAGVIFDFDADAATDPVNRNANMTDLVHGRIEYGYTLDEFGVQQQVTSETFYTYDAGGRLKTVKGPNPRSFTKHFYDGSGNRISTSRYVDVTDQGADVLVTDFDDGGFDAFGNPYHVKDPNGQVTIYTYDGVGRVKTVKPPYAGGDSTMTFTYDLDGRVTRIDFPGNYSLDFGYSDDGKGNLRFIADSALVRNAVVYEYSRSRRTASRLYSNFVDLGNRGTEVGTAEFTYDLPGRLEKALNPLFADDSVYTQFGYDDNANATSVTDENGKVDSLFYDALDRVTGILQTRTSGVYSTEFEYDVALNVEQVKHGIEVLVPGSGKATDYVTDDLGRLVEVDSPDTNTTRLVYDEAGNLTKKVEDAGGAAERETGYEYDGLNRLTKIDLPTDDDWDFIYDDPAGLNERGRLSVAENASGTVRTSFDYTPRGELNVELLEYGGRNYATTYTYDAAGNIDTIETPAKTVIDYHYGDDLRVDKVDVYRDKDGLGEVKETIESIEWMPFGPLKSAEFPAGTTLTRTHNERYQLESILVEDGSGTDLVDRSYEYDYTAGTPGPDDAGPNLDKVVDALDSSESVFYFYDDLDRLDKVTDLSGVVLYDFDHDAAGNRTRKVNGGNTTTYAYEAGTDRLESATGAEGAFYAHDAYGNRIYEGSTAYSGTPTHTYDERNRLVLAPHTSGGQPVSAVYDAFGRRIAWNTTMVFAYDQEGRILEVSNDAGPGSWFGDLVWVEGELLGRVEKDVVGGEEPPGAWTLPGLPMRLPFGGPLVGVAGGGVALVLLIVAGRSRSPSWALASAAAATVAISGVGCVPTGQAFLWVITDHIGKPIAMTDTPGSGDAEVVWKASYAPFGQATANLDPDGDGTDIRMPVRFPGQWWDFATALHYNMFRDYDPVTGRYLEADPTGQDGGVALYEYARNAPMNHSDRLGLDPDEGGRPLGRWIDRAREVARRVGHRILDEVGGGLLDRVPSAKLVACELEKEKCFAACTAENLTSQQQRDRVQECEDEFAQCSRKAGREMLREPKDELGPTAPDYSRRRAPNAQDLFSRGRGKKVD